MNYFWCMISFCVSFVRVVVCRYSGLVVGAVVVVAHTYECAHAAVAMCVVVRKYSVP
jgi:hypothetical protein